MYKLTVISGPNRGSSYAVQEGEVSIGRQPGNSVVLSSSKVSKRHCVIQVNGDDLILHDEGSSNGTFVNGILIKNKKLGIGDRISVGQFVLELTKPSRRAKAVPAVVGMGNNLQFNGGPPPMPGAEGIIIPSGPPPVPGADLMNIMGPLSANDRPPADFRGKAIWYFENRVMPILYAWMTRYEWRYICVGFFLAFVLGNLLLSVSPLMDSNRITVVKETGLRARFMARLIAEQNAPYLAARAETKTEIGAPENADGVKLALLMDLDTRILAPGSKLNQYLGNSNEAILAVAARDKFRNGTETGFVVEAEPSRVVAIEPVKILSATAGKNVIVAMSLVSIDTSLSTPDFGEMCMVYAQTLIMTGILGGIILLFLYKVTLKPFSVLNEDLDKALKGDLSQVSHEFKFEEMNALWEIINSAIQRIPKGGANSNTLGGLGSQDNTSAVEQFLGPLRTLGSVSNFGLVVFNSEQKISYINPIFEEISGIRMDSAVGQQMSDVARDQAMGVFTSDLLSRLNAGDEGQSEEYDFSGNPYKVYAAAFGSPGSTPKAYILLTVRSEG